MDALKVAKQQLHSFLLRHGLRYSRPSYWTKSHWRWINELRRFSFPHQQLAFEELKRNIHQIMACLATLNAAIEDAVKEWRFGPVVASLRALRGVDTVIAAIRPRPPVQSLSQDAVKYCPIVPHGATKRPTAFWSCHHVQ